MASVPNTTTFCLSNVTAIVGTTSLCAAFQNANSSYFDPNYSGSKMCLLNFRNYTTVIPKTVQFCVYESDQSSSYAYACFCLVISPAMSGGEYFYLCTAASASIDVYDGSSSNANVMDSGGYLNITANYWQNYQDASHNYYMTSSSYCGYVVANTEFGCFNTAQLYIYAITQGNGCFQMGSCTNILVHTGY